MHIIYVIGMHIHICISLHCYLSVYTYCHAYCAYIYIYIYIHTYMHTHVYIDIYIYIDMCHLAFIGLAGAAECSASQAGPRKGGRLKNRTSGSKLSETESLLYGSLSKLWSLLGP